MAAMRKTEQHYARLLNALKTNGKLGTKEAAELLKVSDSTVRRLFLELEKDGRVLRTFGGITYVTRTNNEDYIYEQAASQQLQSKEGIGKAAARQVINGDVIYVDSGSTTLHFAQSLCERIKNKEIFNVVVVTNSFRHASLLGHDCTVFIAGGEYQPNSGSNTGCLTEDFVSSFNYTKCFLSCDGVCIKNGFSSRDIASARVNQKAISFSSTRFLLIASNKFDKPSFYAFASLDTVDHIYTDEGANEKFIKSLNEHSVSVHRVSFDGEER